MDFYEQIAHQLYTYNYKIGNTDFFKPIDFIEAKHKTSEHKGDVFYKNVMNAMPIKGHHFNGGYKDEIFRTVLNYCNNMISEVSNESNSEIKIFKIDKNASKFQLTSGGQRNYLDNLSHPLNLQNLNTYNENGEIVSKADLKRYINEFSMELCRSKFSLAPEMKSYLTYHYLNSEDKEAFLEILKHNILTSDYVVRKPRVGVIVNEWIDENITKNSESKQFKPLVKIKWSGQKNQLFDVLRTLKEEKKLIDSSYADLAVFLKQNFEGFENTALNTIQTELQRGKRPPKSKRVNLDAFDIEEK